MPVIYKLWLHIERVDEDADTDGDVSEPVELACSVDRSRVEEIADKVTDSCLGLLKGESNAPKK